MLPSSPTATASLTTVTYSPTLGIPQPPYWNGRYSNGPVAVERLSSCLGVPLLDEAWGGATTGVGDVLDNGTTTTLGYDDLPGMATSFNGTILSFPPGLVSGSLVVVWGGINDFATNGLTTLTADHAVRDIVAIVTTLQAMGAKQILVPGIPDLGFAPLYLAEGKGGYANYVSDYFNKELRMSLPPGVLYYDTATLYRKMIQNPSQYGLTNVHQPCYVQQSGVCQNPYQYLLLGPLASDRARSSDTGARTFPRHYRLERVSPRTYNGSEKTA